MLVTNETQLVMWGRGSCSHHPKYWDHNCIITSPLIYLHALLLTWSLESEEFLFGQGGGILLGCTEYVRELSFWTDSLPFPRNAPSEKYLQQNISYTMCFLQSFLRTFGFGEDWQTFSGLTGSGMFSVCKLNRVQTPLFQMELFLLVGRGLLCIV